SQLHTLKFKQNEKIEAFLRRVTELRASILALGEVVSDDALIPIVLRALPSSYCIFVITLNLLDTTVSFEKLVNLLQQEEAIHNKDDEEEQALSSHQKWKGK
ncbi:hypothetical protein KI387_016432, partial [Taxus chinensis]